jgi:hypothetical protein
MKNLLEQLPAIVAEGKREAERVMERMAALGHMSKAKPTTFRYTTGYARHWRRWPIGTVAVPP